MKFFLVAALTAPFLSAAAGAEIRVTDAYARSSSPMAKAGAAFFKIENTGETADRLVAVESSAAKRTELHSHAEVDGVMQMRHVEDGFAVPPGAMRMLARGGDHVMFMGLTLPWAQGDVVPVTLIFEEAGRIEVEIPVDRMRKP